MPQKTPANSSRRTQRDSSSPEPLVELAAERDHYRSRLEKLQDRYTKVEDKLETSNRDLRDAKSEIKRLQEQLTNNKRDNETLKKACKQLGYEKSSAETDLIQLRASYDNLKYKYDAIPEERRNPMVTAIPERPKRAPASGSSGGSSGGPSMSSWSQQQEAERRRQADNERLVARFERTGGRETSRRPPTSGGHHRNSYIEGFGSRRRSGSAAPTTRVAFDDVAHTRRFDEPLTSHRNPIVYSNVPRRVPSNTGYYSGGSSALVDDDFEDGDYHLRPVP